MIKALMKNKNGNPIIILGLSEKNLEKLRDKLSILVDLKDLDPELKGEIWITYGQTEKDIHNEFINAGFKIRNFEDKR